MVITSAKPHSLETFLFCPYFLGFFMILGIRPFYGIFDSAILVNLLELI